MRTVYEFAKLQGRRNPYVRLRTKTKTVKRGLKERINASRRRTLLLVRGKGYGMTLRSFLRSRQKQVRAVSHRQVTSRLLKDQRFRRGYEEELEKLVTRTKPRKARLSATLTSPRRRLR